MLERLTGEVASDTDLCSLYGALPLAQQQKRFNRRRLAAAKVVLATNIAETSLTIEGIRLVVDSGLERVARHDVRNGLTRWRRSASVRRRWCSAPARWAPRSRHLLASVR